MTPYRPAHITRLSRVMPTDKSNQRGAFGSVSVEWKLTGVISALTLVGTLSLGVYLPTRQVQRLEAGLERKALTIARLTAHQVEPAIAFSDPDTAHEVFDAMMLDPDVGGLALLRADGQAVYRTGKLAPLVGLPPSVSGQTVFPIDGAIRVLSPVISKEGPRGTLVVDLALDYLRAERRLVYTTAASIGAVGLLMGTLAAWLIARSIASRVKRLASATTRIAQGDLETAVPEDASGDEIGQLATAFAHMVGSIRSLLTQISDQAKRENDRLEVLVQARTKELDARTAAMRLVLDHVAQGFVTVDAAGVASKERSRILETWLGTPRDGATFAEYIAAADPRAAAGFRGGWSQIADDILPFDVILAQLPTAMRKEEQWFRLEYTAIGGPTEPAALVVMSDITAEVSQRRAEEGRRDLMNLFEAVLTDRSGVMSFFVEADDLMALIDGTRPGSKEDVRRAIHTLKGNSDLMGVKMVARLCHELEDRLADLDRLPTPQDLDELARAWRDLVAGSRSLLGEGTDRIELEKNEYDELLRTAENPERADHLAHLRSLAFEPTVRRLNRLAVQARTLAARLGKDGLDVQVQPNGVRLPAAPWAPFWSSFVHVVRNAIDHGIETTEERLAVGKRPAGTIRIRTVITHEGLAVELSDDGRGIDWQAVARRAAANGLPSETQSDLEAALFSDGMSTAAEVTDISGRGVGLGAVRVACEALGGEVAISTTRGRGTTFHFRFPHSNHTDSAGRIPVARPSFEPRSRSSFAPPPRTSVAPEAREAQPATAHFDVR